MSSDRRYSQEEVDAILKRALERDRGPTSDAITHQDLLDTAHEVGIEPAQVEAAITEVKREQQALTVRQEWLRRRKERLRRSAVSWAAVSAFCLVLNLAFGGTWWLWVFGPWGVAVLLQYLRAQRGPSERDLMWMERRLRSEQRKHELQASFERGAQVLETVVEQGANLLLAHLDERTRRQEALKPGPPPLPPKR